MFPDSASRPNAPQGSKSFSRMEDTLPSTLPRNRAKTVHGIMTPEFAQVNSPLLSLEPGPIEEEADIFHKRDSLDLEVGSPVDKSDPTASQLQNMVDQFELPIELASLTDRFITSLSAKVYATPPSIDKLSDLFQDFYVRAGAHISTHISTLSSRLNRPPPVSSSQSTISAKSTRDPLINASGNKDDQRGSEKPTTNQQMLTAEEVAEKRRARKMLQFKRHALEEAVERRACEAVYEKIWRHKTTLDEVRDEKLRSKTAALALIGIELKDLGIEMWDLNGAKGTEVSDYLSSARESLMRMNDEKFPLGKLQHLTAAHKAIVDTLTKVLPSSSSADEILPTLIYTLISTPAEGINIISNLLFIQRFRATSRLDGEAAYCLTNLEAAISFLENVDLNGLPANQAQEGMAKPSTGASVPVTMRPDPQITQDFSTNPGSSMSTPMSSKTGKPDLSGQITTSESSQKSRMSDHSPFLTNLLQPSAKAFGAANDAVRTTADQGFKNISSTLDNSFNFLFGRLREVQIKQSGEPNGISTILPKTLDDARRLVSPSPMLGDGNDLKGDSSSGDQPNQSSKSELHTRPEDRLLGLISGRKTARQTGGDSLGNAAGGLKAIPTTGETSTPSPASTGSIFSQSTPNPPFGAMKSFSNTLNPLNHIPGMIRGLGRIPPDPTQSLVSADKPKTSEPISSRSNTPIPQKVNANSHPAAIKPPIKKFLEIDPEELKISEIPELLADYKRLALILSEQRIS
ncbi:hypothetical protein PAAG_06298 [Paracoccidioides lutzii Pb01]|uniref:VPS9 domain-containing protein n=1 Tax=Paracoccidioides lutzii (strain ATCC MYA-826 / Pb01) TaxID=502779 RepID=C1H6A7_PARBA|nr:hypothetical protein PAAG_06298 [Paracoccidioides lutzii Pb01]EEH35251.2 hypothetical protein PAAG_06298 [Paracoccidioides lutzii Pb01]